jgi:hypothetical protein
MVSLIMAVEVNCYPLAFVVADMLEVFDVSVSVICVVLTVEKDEVPRV